MKALTVGATVIAFMVTIPILNVVGSLFVSADEGIWAHLIQTVLPRYVANSAALVIGVGSLACLLGVPAAWFTAVCEFRYRRLFVWMLPLPLAMPAYIVAYTYTGLLDYPGPVQSAIRNLTGWSKGEYWFPEIRSLGGAAAMLGFVLYPYVYLLARTSFLERSMRTLEVSRTLGHGVFRSFFRLSLPLARPAIATGTALVAMETLADYGTVQYFGVSTFTTGIFRTFYGLGDSTAALQLSALLLAAVAILLFCERLSRRRARFDANFENVPSCRIPLSNSQTALAWLFCGTPVILGFVIPVAILLKYAVVDSEWIWGNHLRLAWNSFHLGAIAAAISVSLAIALAFAVRMSGNPVVKLAASLSGLGYAIPGTIIALGILAPLIWVDHLLIDLVELILAQNVGLIISGSIAALLFAYTVRFLAISLGSVAAGLEKIKHNLDHSARALGRKPVEILFRVHLPMLRNTILSALLIVFVDVIKELPATLILRPFNFNTLAVRAYELASDERLADAAAPSIMIVLVGIIPVIVLNRTIFRESS